MEFWRYVERDSFLVRATISDSMARISEVS